MKAKYLAISLLLTVGCADAPEPSEEQLSSSEAALTGEVALRSRLSGLCLEAPREGALPRMVQLKRCAEDRAQRWQVSPTPENPSVVRLINSGTGLCLDSNQAQQLYVFGCNGGTWQKWFVNQLSPREIDFASNEQTGFCLDGAGGARTASCNGSDAQRWNTGVSTRIKYSGVINHGGNAGTSERVDVLGGPCTPGFTRVTPPQLQHEGHGSCSFDGWQNPFFTGDCTARIRVRDEALFLRGHCNWAIFEQN